MSQSSPSTDPKEEKIFNAADLNTERSPSYCKKCKIEFYAVTFLFVHEYEVHGGPWINCRGDRPPGRKV